MVKLSMNNTVSIKTTPIQKIFLLVFSVLFGLILLESGLRIAGAVFISVQERRNIESVQKANAYRILCLGESTTAFGGEHSYPRQLEKILQRRLGHSNISVINKGLPGTTTTMIVDQLETNIDLYQPDMIIAMMGINDPERTAEHPANETSKGSLKKILDREHSRDRGEVNKDENKTSSRLTNFLKSLRVYKLFKFIETNGLRKFKAMTLPNQEGILLNQIRRDPKNVRFYNELGTYYRMQGQYRLAENIYQENIKKNGEKDEAYLELGDLYLELGRYDEAKTILRQALDINPNNYQAYVDLAESMKFNGDTLGAEKMFLKAMLINRRRNLADQLLGCFYWNLGRYDEAEDLLLQAIEKIQNRNDEYSQFLESCVWTVGDFSRSERIFKRAIDMDPGNDELPGALANLYEFYNNDEMAKKYYHMADEIRLRYYNPLTLGNYHQMRNLTFEKGIRLVVMQYPMLGVGTLKKMFPDDNNIIFIDNEVVFKEAVKKDGYNVYFSDMFGGGFGHCTPKGNKLLAEHVASVLIEGIKNDINHRNANTR